MNYSTEASTGLLDQYPNVGLTLEPTPIHRRPRLSTHLEHDIHIMRDDLSGFGIGGNKVRKLDFLIGDAVARKADTLVTSVASSFSRIAALAGRVHGFEVHVVVSGTAAEQSPARHFSSRPARFFTMFRSPARKLCSESWTACWNNSGRQAERSTCCTRAAVTPSGAWAM